MNSKEAGIFVLFWFSLKERGSVGLKVLTRNKGEHLPHPLDLWNVGGKKKNAFLEATGTTVSARAIGF